MRRFESFTLTPVCILALAGYLLAQGCTFRVSSVPVEASTSDDAAGISLVAGDFEHTHADIDVAGDTRATIDVRLFAEALVLSGDEEAVRSGARVELVRDTELAGAGGAEIVAHAPEGFEELVRLTRVIAEVPSSTAVRLRLGSSSAMLSNVGDVFANAGSGSIDVSGAGDVEIEAGSGSITAFGVGEGRLLRAGSGSIDVELRGGFDAETGSGSIRGAVGDGGRAEAGTGSIDLRVTRALTRNLELSAGSGSVTLELAAGATDVELDLDADSGSIDVALRDVQVHHSESPLRMVVGAGGPLIYVRTGSGSITVAESAP